MIFQTPTLRADDLRALTLIEEQRRQLRIHVAEPRRWVGRLRRTSLARAIQGSNSIEGYVVGLDDALAAVENEDPLETGRATWQAILGYRNAMTYVLRLATDPHFVVNEALLKSLQFMMTQYDLRTNPGTWRRGDIYVRNDVTGEVVYTGADSDDIPALMAELVAQIDDSDDPPLVRAAMAHLNLVMIHPFTDGNGRMARCLQTLVLAREGILAPQFSSVEEYLGANTDAYYRVLADVGQGHWKPTGDARPWIRFMLTAHYRQGATLLRRVSESQSLWQLVEDLASTRGVHQRSFSALFDAAQGRRIRRSSYLASLEDPVSDAVATRDLRNLVAAGLLVAHGERRAREYRASPEVAALQISVRRRAADVGSLDPYARDADPTLF